MNKPLLKKRKQIIILGTTSIIPTTQSWKEREKDNGKHKEIGEYNNYYVVAH